MKYRIKNSLIGVLTTLIVYGVLFFLQFAVLYYVGIFFRDHRDTLQAAFFILHFFVGLHIIL